MNETKPTTLYAIKQKKSGRLIAGTDYNYRPCRQRLSDENLPPLLFTGDSLLREIKHREISLRNYTVVGVTVEEVKNID